MKDKNDEVEILDIDEIKDENLNPDGLFVNEEMVMEDIQAQIDNDETLLVQDNFNEDDIFEFTAEGSSVEVVE